MPNRFTDGYGPNITVYQDKIAAGTQLIITVDNGVSGHEAIAYAQGQGVDVIVTDHHELPAELRRRLLLSIPVTLKETILLVIWLESALHLKWLALC